MKVAKVVHLREIDTAKLFEMKSLMLGTPNKGKWFVVDDELYLGRYESREDAVEHVEAISENLPVAWDHLAAACEKAGKPL